MEVDTEVAEEDSRASSSVEFKASELRSGLVSVLTAFGSHTSVSLDSCHVDGSTNYGILASKASPYSIMIEGRWLTLSVQCP
jgi:hypothetical protein